MRVPTVLLSCLMLSTACDPELVAAETAEPAPSACPGVSSHPGGVGALSDTQRALTEACWAFEAEAASTYRYSWHEELCIEGIHTYAEVLVKGGVVVAVSEEDGQQADPAAYMTVPELYAWLMELESAAPGVVEIEVDAESAVPVHVELMPEAMDGEPSVRLDLELVQG